MSLVDLEGLGSGQPADLVKFLALALNAARVAFTAPQVEPSGRGLIR
ncbi:hypothetical protein [Kibdelosporangium philippinense]